MRWIEQILLIYSIVHISQDDLGLFCKTGLSTNSISIFHFYSRQGELQKQIERGFYSSATHFFGHLLSYMPKNNLFFKKTSFKSIALKKKVKHAKLLYPLQFG